MAGGQQSALWESVPELAGRHVRLVPLRREHAAGMARARDDDGLDGLWYTSLPPRGDCLPYIEAALAQQARGEALAFAVLDAAGEVAGSTRLYALDPKVPRAVVGYTWYAPRVQRTGLNTEAKLLLLQHAFEAMGCISVGFETSMHNERSRAAILRLGAKQEGILRNHKRHADGSPRDSVVFSITDGEWPEVKRGLLDKLHKHEAGQ